jgi:predicted site-specific integrase-resolvase
MSETPLVDAHAVAKRFGVSYATVLGWARRGVVPCLRAGHHPVRFEIDAVEDALRARGRSRTKAISEGPVGAA